ncbi:MAG: sigma-70 family RNA polymerase sigma factor [Candidatus Eremiobacteraeota bacterium]|nr:sigma-70 family RNA polymerase sigma factor [Candidatus Eremiobacteraeota bacterium]
MQSTLAAPKKAAAAQALRADRDLALIDSYRAGRREAFDELVVAYDQPVRRILAQLSVLPGDVEDLAQEVFLRLFRNLYRFRGQSSFYTWLYRITVNVFFDHNKKRKRADVRLTRLQTALVDVTNVREEGEDPYFACCNALAQDEFVRAVDDLPEAFRTVVALREIEDLSYEEIAAQTGVSIGTVRSRLSRARARLKTTLRPFLSSAA